MLSLHDRSLFMITWNRQSNPKVETFFIAAELLQTYPRFRISEARGPGAPWPGGWRWVSFPVVAPCSQPPSWGWDSTGNRWKWRWNQDKGGLLPEDSLETLERIGLKHDCPLFPMQFRVTCCQDIPMNLGINIFKKHETKLVSWFFDEPPSFMGWDTKSLRFWGKGWFFLWISGDSVRLPEILVWYWI